MEKRKTENTKHEIIRLCRSGLAPRALWSEALKRLRRVVPVDAGFFGTADPATLLFTSSVAESALERSRQRFLENEFLQNDVNQFRNLARRHVPVGTLYQATFHQMERSPRYRDILVPLAMGDELRAALRANGACWGFFCLHREQSSPNFTRAEAEFVGALVPHLAEAIRAGILLGNTAAVAESCEEPGLLLLAKDLSIAAITPATERWLSEVAADDWPSSQELPTAIQAVAIGLLAVGHDKAVSSKPVPQVRLRTRSGRWLVLHASWLSESEREPRIAVIVEVARPWEIAPVIVEAYGLTPREREIAQLVMHGFSTTELSAALRISLNTVQDHLKSIFEKVGVHSRRELVAQVFAGHYEPRIRVGDSPSGNGWFRSSRNGQGRV